MKVALDARRRQLEALFGKPQLSDEIGFVCGVFAMLILQAILLLYPESMGHVYALMLAPLLVVRYAMYRMEKAHYFMVRHSVQHPQCSSH